MQGMWSGIRHIRFS